MSRYVYVDIYITRSSRTFVFSFLYFFYLSIFLPSDNFLHQGSSIFLFLFSFSFSRNFQSFSWIFFFVLPFFFKIPSYIFLRYGDPAFIHLMFSFFRADFYSYFFFFFIIYLFCLPFGRIFLLPYSFLSLKGIFKIQWLIWHTAIFWEMRVGRFFATNRSTEENQLRHFLCFIIDLGTRRKYAASKFYWFFFNWHFTLSCEKFFFLTFSTFLFISVCFS